MNEFIPLHVHSHYSLLDGLAKIDQLIAKAKKLAIPALALTDHGVMYGAIEFYQKCQKAGIKPIIGCEVYLAPRKMTDKQPRIDTRPHHLILLVKDNTGYKNLIKLVSQAHLQGFYYKPRVDKELLKKYHQGLIALTSCLHGEIPKLLINGKYQQAKRACQFYIETYGQENFFLELQSHPELPEQDTVNQGLVKLSKELGLGLVATNDTHYLNREDAQAHEVLLSVQTGKDIDDRERLSMIKVDLSFIEPDKIKKYFANLPQAIENSKKISDRCNLQLQLGKPILPKFAVPAGQTPMEYLEKLAQAGFKKKYSATDKIAHQRLDFELAVIEKTGFADYFLIVADFINWAKNNKIMVGPGRGSAAGSIVSFCLGVTDIEPLKYGLLFERFLNPERISMPDIDIDFADDRRDEVISYVKEKYGKEHVAQIITFGTMAARGSIRDTARALGLSYDDGDRIAKLIPFGFSISQALQEVSELKYIYQTDPKFKRLIEMAKKLEGVARHASTHACGIVIAKEPLIEYLPLQQAQKGQTSVTTQYPMYDVDSIGLLKMDFLGLSNLTIIRNTLRIIRKIKNQKIEITKIPLDDKKTYQLFSHAETTGVFQLESDGMKRYLKELKPSNFNDVIAMVALYRPGPMELIPAYIKRKHGQEKITYLHPKLEPILKNTYGIGVYQEQMMQIAQQLAGFTLPEADILRKAIGKKIKKLLGKQKEKLISGMKKNGIGEATAKKIWELFPPFARYGFNKSHAASYAMIAYQTAYLKVHWPAAFMAALLTSDFGNLDRVAIEITECERMGLKVLPPNVNSSFVEFGVVPFTENILFGLSAIKNVGVGASDKIVEGRKLHGLYKSLEDFILRLGPDVVNKKTMEALAKSGALDCLIERNKLLANLDIILRFSSALNRQISPGQISLFAEGKGKTSLISLKLNTAEPASKKQRLAWERELLGMYLSEHPLKEVKHELAKHTKPIVELSNVKERQKTTIGGIITAIQKIITRSKEPMIFARLEDTTANIEVLVFPKLLQKNPLLWQTDNIVVIKGYKNSKDGVSKFIAEEITPWEKIKNPPRQNTPQADFHQTLMIKIPSKTNRENLLKLKKNIAEHPGLSPVYLMIPDNQVYKKINLRDKVEINDILTQEISRLVGKENIEII